MTAVMYVPYFQKRRDRCIAGGHQRSILLVLFFGSAFLSGGGSTAALPCTGNCQDGSSSRAESAEGVPGENQRPVRIEARALLAGDSRIVTCEVGELEVGVAYIVELTLSNGRQDPFEFGMLIGSCSCMHLTVNEGVIPPGGSSKIEVELRVRASKLESQLDTILSFFRTSVESNPVLMLKLLASIKGNLYIDQRTSTLGLSRGVTEHFIPVAISSPVTAGNLVVEKSDSFADMVVRLEQTDHGFGLRCLVNSEMIGEGYLNGTISVRDSKSGKSHSLNLLLEKKPPFRLSAGILYFRNPPKPIEGEEAGELEKACQANALVSIDASWFDIDGKQDHEPKTPGIDSASARIGDHQLTVRLRKLSAAVYRVEIDAPDELLDRSAGQEIDLALEAGVHGKVFSLPWKRFDK